MSESTGIKPKRFGASKVPQPDAPESSKKTPVEAEASDGLNKWLTGIEDQVSDKLAAENLETDLDIRAVPLDRIQIDQSNPRDLAISPEDILKHLDDLKLPVEAFDDDQDEWLEPYQNKVFTLYGESKKAQDCMNIALFAAALKSPKNVMSPICVWREEVNFYLFAGERRYLAHYLMGATHVLTRIWHEKPTGLAVKVLEWQENNEREDLSFHEKLINIRQILERWIIEKPTEKLTVRTFGRVVSMKKSQAAVWYKVANSHSQVLNDAIKTGVVTSVELAYELLSVSSEELPAFIERLRAGEKINKAQIQGEKLVGKQASVNTKIDAKRQTLKFNAKADTKPVAFVVRTVAQKIDSPALNAQLEKLDYAKPKDLSKALLTLMEFLETEGVSE